VSTPDRANPTLSTAEFGEAGVLPRHELARRASAGIVIVFTRGVATALFGFGGGVVLARLLDPNAFGLVAIGMAIVMFGTLLGDGGVGAGLIRRAEPPTAEELQTLTGFQLGVTLALSAAAAALAPLFGEAGWVTALIVSSTPLVMLQISGRILLERSLSYRSLAAVELSQVVAYNVCAIGLVLIGLGVWGMASATVAMRLVGVFLMARVSPAGLMRPRFSWRLIRPLLGFGVRFQGANATWLVSQQARNVSLAAIGGVSTLGLWSLASRVLQLPSLFFAALSRVSFPTMSRLVGAKEDVAPLIEQAVGMIAIGTGIIMTGLVGSAPGLFPGVFGDQWREASLVMPGACLGIGISASISVASQGYLYAVGDASAVLRYATRTAIATFAVTLPLVPVIGISAIGLGEVAASLVGAHVLRRSMLHWAHVDVVRPLFVPVAAGVVSGGVGWLVADFGGGDLISGLAGGTCSTCLFLVLVTAFRRRLVYELFRFTLVSVRAAVHGAPAPLTPV
jgi:O-antigen/teichoic acid export membrane protein